MSDEGRKMRVAHSSLITHPSLLITHYSLLMPHPSCLIPPIRNISFTRSFPFFDSIPRHATTDTARNHSRLFCLHDCDDANIHTGDRRRPATCRGVLRRAR